MLSKLSVLLTVCLFVLNARAQNNKQNDTLTPVTSQDSVFCAVLQDGIIMVVMNDDQPISQQIRLSNGTTIMPDGTYIKQDGTEIKLNGGECINLNGDILTPVGAKKKEKVKGTRKK